MQLYDWNGIIKVHGFMRGTVRWDTFVSSGFVYFDEGRNGWVIVDFKTGKQTEAKELQYQEQLNFYESVLVQSGLNVVGKGLLWV